MFEFSMSGILVNNFGEQMDSKQFYEFLFREYLEDIKSFGFLANEIHNFTNSLAFNSVEKAKELEVWASHFSIALYYKPTSRLKENIRYQVAIPLDIDWGKKGVKASISEVWHFIERKYGLEISALRKSKTPFCYHGLIRIEMATGTPKTIHLVEWIAKEIARTIDADLGGANANQWLRVNKDGKYWTKYSNKIYNLDELKRFLPSEESLRARKNEIDAGVTSLDKYRVENHPAIKALLNGNIVSWRNHACFTAALMLRLLGYSEEEAYEHLSGEWFERVNGSEWDEPFKMREVKDSVKSAYSGKYMGPSKEWIYNVTGIEFPYNLYYVRTKYKKADEVRAAIVNYLREKGEVRAKQKDLASYIGMPYRSVQRAVKWLKEKGIIEYETVQGGNDKNKQGTIFRLLNNDVFSKKENVVVEVDFGYQELNEQMS